MSCRGGLFAVVDGQPGPGPQLAMPSFLSTWLISGPLPWPAPSENTCGGAFGMSLVLPPLLQLLQARMLVVRQLLPPLPVLVNSSLQQLPG